MLLFQHCPLFSGFTGAEHIAAYEDFLAYKVRVPVRGAILLDESMKQVVLVRGWKKGANWSFPRGKINKDERDLDCAIREVDEETGFDVRAAGLVPVDEADAKYIDITMREQHLRMFVFRNVPLDTYFEPKTRKEISKIQWYNLRELPGFAKKNKQTNNGQEQGILQANKFYMVAPFLGPLKKWINQQRRRDLELAAREDTEAVTQQEALVEKEDLETDAILAATLDKSQELKRLLSIAPAGMSFDAAQPSVFPDGSYVESQPEHRPQAFQTDQSHRDIHPSSQLPFSTQQPAQPQRNISLPVTSGFANERIITHLLNGPRSHAQSHSFHQQFPHVPHGQHAHNPRPACRQFSSAIVSAFR